MAASSGTKKINEQFVTRTIRKAVIAFESTDDPNQKMKALMAVSALSSLNLIQNVQMVMSTSRFIEAKLGL